MKLLFEHDEVQKRLLKSLMDAIEWRHALITESV